jgi:hypothetical protein
VGAAARNRDELLRDELDEDDDELLLQFIWFVQKPNNGSVKTKTSQQRVDAVALSMLPHCCVLLGTYLAFYEAIAGHDNPPPTPLWTRRIFIFIHFVSTNRSSFAQQFRHSAGASPGARAHLKSGLMFDETDVARFGSHRPRGACDDCLSNLCNAKCRFPTGTSTSTTVFYLKTASSCSSPSTRTKIFELSGSAGGPASSAPTATALLIAVPTNLRERKSIMMTMMMMMVMMMTIIIIIIIIMNRVIAQ